MSWFSFSERKQDKRATSPTPAKTAPKSRGVLWLETSSEEVYQKTLTNMWEEVKDLKGFPKDSHAKNARIYTGVILKKIQKIDRTRLSVEQKKTLAAIVFTNIPRAVADMETMLADIDQMHDAVEEFGDTLRDLMSRFVDTMPRKIPVPNELANVSEESTKKVVESVGTKESDEKLVEVKALAAEAYRLATNVEDRFFAEQAANSYIPDSVRMLSGLINAPDDMKAEANELFLKQLEIIETQLNGVVRRSASNSLSAMKAHTEFLESKKSQLELG